MSSRPDELVSLRKALEPLAWGARPAADCPRAERLWKAVHQQLDTVEAHAVVDHLGSCPSCAEAWEVAEDMRMSRALVWAPSRCRDQRCGFPESHFMEGFES